MLMMMIIIMLMIVLLLMMMMMVMMMMMMMMRRPSSLRVRAKPRHLPIYIYTYSHCVSFQNKSQEQGFTSCAHPVGIDGAS